MRVLVRILRDAYGNYSTIAINISQNSSVAEIKVHIFSQIHIPPHQQKLSFKQKGEMVKPLPD